MSVLVGRLLLLLFVSSIATAYYMTFLEDLDPVVELPEIVQLVAALSRENQELRAMILADRAERAAEKEAAEARLRDMYRFFKSASAEAKTGSNGHLRQVQPLDWRTIVHLMAHKFFGIDVPAVERDFEEVKNEMWKHLPAADRDGLAEVFGKRSQDKVGAGPETLYLGKHGHINRFRDGLSVYDGIATMEQFQGALMQEQREAVEGVAGGYYGRKKVEEILRF